MIKQFNFINISLQLLYVDSIKWDVPRIIRQRPAIRSWSLDMLTVRMESEMEAGGLGLGELDEPYVNEEAPRSPSSIEVPKK